jgi:hypothetical protein
MVFWSFRCGPVSGGPFTSVAPTVSPGAMILSSQARFERASQPRATEANGPPETEWRRQPRGFRTSRQALRYCGGRSPLKSDRKAEIRSIPPSESTKTKFFVFLWKGVRAYGAASGPAVESRVMPCPCRGQLLLQVRRGPPWSAVVRRGPPWPCRIPGPRVEHVGPSPEAKCARSHR